VDSSQETINTNTTDNSSIMNINSSTDTYNVDNSRLHTDGPWTWNPSMGMRHPDRPCLINASLPGECGPDRRSPEQKASDPYDTNNPASQAARANPAVTEPHAKVTDNSMRSDSHVNSNTQVDSSQETSHTNTTDNSSIMNINSSTDTYNVDNSRLHNEMGNGGLSPLCTINPKHLTPRAMSERNKRC
jgi:hypothetical protein